MGPWLILSQTSPGPVLIKLSWSRFHAQGAVSCSTLSSTQSFVLIKNIELEIMLNWAWNLSMVWTRLSGMLKRNVMAVVTHIRSFKCDIRCKWRWKLQLLRPRQSNLLEDGRRLNVWNRSISIWTGKGTIYSLWKAFYMLELVGQGEIFQMFQTVDNRSLDLDIRRLLSDR